MRSWWELCHSCWTRDWVTMFSSSVWIQSWKSSWWKSLRSSWRTKLLYVISVPIAPFPTIFSPYFLSLPSPPHSALSLFLLPCLPLSPLSPPLPLFPLSLPFLPPFLPFLSFLYPYPVSYPLSILDPFLPAGSRQYCHGLWSGVSRSYWPNSQELPQAVQPPGWRGWVGAGHHPQHAHEICTNPVCWP